MVSAMIRLRAAAEGILKPADIDLLARVYAASVLETHSELDREHLASRIIANYQTGITDEAELISLSRQALGR